MTILTHIMAFAAGGIFGMFVMAVVIAGRDK